MLNTLIGNADYTSQIFNQEAQDGNWQSYKPQMTCNIKKIDILSQSTSIVLYSRDALVEGTEVIIYDGQSFKKGNLGPVTYDGGLAPIQRISEAVYTNKFKNIVLSTGQFTRMQVVDNDERLIALDTSNNLHTYRFGVPGDVTTLTKEGIGVDIIFGLNNRLTSHTTKTLSLGSANDGSYGGDRIYMNNTAATDQPLKYWQNGYGMGVTNQAGMLSLNPDTFMTESKDGNLPMPLVTANGVYNVYPRSLHSHGYQLSSSIGDLLGMATGANIVFTRGGNGVVARSVTNKSDARTISSSILSTIPSHIGAAPATGNALHVSHDGKKIVFISMNGQLVQWNLATPYDLSTATRDIEGTVSYKEIAFSRDGLTMYSLENPFLPGNVSSGWSVRKHNLASPFNVIGRTTGTRYVICGYHMAAAVHTTRFVYHEWINAHGQGSPNGRPNVVSIANIAAGNYVYPDIGSTNYGVHGVWFEHKNGRLFCNCIDSSAGTITIREFDTQNGTTLQQRTISSIPFRQFCFSEDGRRVFGRVSNNVIGQFNLSSAWTLSTMNTTPSAMYSHFAVDSDRDISTFLFGNGTRSIFVGSYEYNLNTPDNLNTVGRVTSTSMDLVPGTMFSAGGSASSTYFLSKPPAGGLGGRWYSAPTDNVNQFFGSAQVSQQEGDVAGFHMSPDGSKIIVAGANTRSLFRLDLTEPYNVHTARFTLGDYVKFESEGTPAGITFNPTGTVAYYFTGTTQNNSMIRRVSFTTAWDMSTAIMGTNWAISPTSERIGYHDTLVSKDGKRLFGLRRTTSTNRPILEHEIPNGWSDLNGANYTTFTKTFTTQDNQVIAIASNSREDKLYLYGHQYGNIYEYDMNIAEGGAYSADISGLGLVNAPAQAHDTANLPIFQTSFGMPGRSLVNHHTIVPTTVTTTTMTYNEFDGRVPATGDVLRVYNAQNTETPQETNIGTVSAAQHSPQSIGLGQYVKSAFPSIGTSPMSYVFNDVGTKAYLVNGGTSRRVYEFDLSTPFDVSTASYNEISLSVSSQDSTPTGIAFDKRGFNMFVVGKTNRRVNRYKLTSPFDLSTASFDSYLSVGTQATAPEDVMFSDNGKRMYVVNSANGRIFQYNLAAPYKVEGGVYSNLFFSVGTQIGAPVTAKFNNTGSRMYVAGSNGVIHQYSMANPYGISTATYDNVSLNVLANTTTLRGFTFTRDGKNLVCVDGNANGQLTVYGDISVHNYTTYDITFSAVSSTPDNTHKYPELARRRTLHTPTSFSLGGIDDVICHYDKITAEGRELAFHHVGKNPQDLIKMTRYDLTKSNI